MPSRNHGTRLFAYFCILYSTPPRFHTTSSAFTAPDDIALSWKAIDVGENLAMLKQYGIATPSSLTPIQHPEDAQPNERTHARSQKLPPRILGPPPSRGTNYNRGHTQRGSYHSRGRPMYRGGSFTQHAVRGNNNRGRGTGSYRGAAASQSVQKPVLQHWSRLERGVSSAAPIDVDAVGSSPISVIAPISMSSSITISDTPPSRNMMPPPPPAESTQNVSQSNPPSQSTYLPQWLLRSRSPSPKLPPTPLKRRKLDSDDENADSRQAKSPKLSPPVIEANPTLPPPSPPRPRVPLPARTEKQPTPSLSTPARKSSTPMPSRRSTSTVSIKPERSTIDPEPQPSPSVKHERRSPSVPLSVEPERRLITQSANFYPLPALCRKTNPQFAEERRSYFRQKSRELSNLGLKKTKAFWRDDGLVIEWSSEIPVWSDTLKPDIPDLATAIERAYALNDCNLPRRSPKRKRRNSATNDGTTSRNNCTFETPASSSSQPPSTQRQSDYRTPVKHWADGISLEDLQHAPNLLSPTPSIRPQMRAQNRPALPTRKQIPKPAPLSSNTPFTQPDPSAAIPSQEWRMRRAGEEPPAAVYPSKRMIFKPLNPRKSQTGAHDSSETSSTGAQGPAQRANGPPSTTELAHPTQNGNSHAGRDPCEMVPIPPELSTHLSPKSTTPKDVHTPEPASRSPTLVNESLSSTVPHDQQTYFAVEGLGSVPGHVSMSAYDMIVNRTSDAEKEESGCVADFLSRSPDPYEESSEDGESIDEEVESSVQQFISKYASMFDSDRHKLKKAYSKDALFSCRVHHTEPYSCASLFVPESKDSFHSTHARASASQVIRGRTHICDRLLTLGQYQFIPRGVPQNPMYTWSIPSSSGVKNGILLSLHGEVVKPEANPEHDHRLTVDQTFMLRQRMEEDDTDDDDGTDMPGQMNLKNFWPLTIVSHQMVVRSNPLLTTEDLLETVPWVRDIMEAGP